MRMALAIIAFFVSATAYAQSGKYLRVPLPDLGVGTVSLRGGVTTGATSYSKNGRFGTYAFLSTFPLIEPAAIPAVLGGISDRRRAIILAGQYFSHEIGHLLLHLGHPYGNPRCVMRPAQGLDYIRWARKLDPARCKLGSAKALTAGAAKILYRSDW
mgnify:CR=1 FL=1